MIPGCSQDECDIGARSLMGERLVSGSQCRVIAVFSGIRTEVEEIMINGTSLLGAVGVQRPHQD